MGTIAVSGRAVDSYQTLTKTVSASGTPERISATDILFVSATIIGKSAARTNNTGTVYIGFSDTNDSQPLEITSGSELLVNAPSGTCLNLKDFYIDVATNNDGVVVNYI
jgi:hypothetical protein